MDHINFGALNGRDVLEDIKKELKDARGEVERESKGVGDALGDGFEEGFNDSVTVIKASSIKLQKAFSDLAAKIKKQKQQLTAGLNGDKLNLKIDFSDIDINSERFKETVNRIVKDFKDVGAIEFDQKGSEQQFKNLITLYTKYQEKLASLQNNFKGITTPEDATKNLQSQFVLIRQIREIYDFLGQPITLLDMPAIGPIKNALTVIQNLKSETKGSGKDIATDFDGVVEVLNEIKAIILETQKAFKPLTNALNTEGTAFQKMAAEGGASLDILLEKLKELGVLMDEINNKPMTIINQNVTQQDTGLQAMKQQMAIARETMGHLRTLYNDAIKTSALLNESGQLDLIMEVARQLQELDLTAINKSVKGADSEIKLASVLAEMQDYIDRLIQINELRNKYNLGEWKDTFVSKVKPTVQPVVHQENADAIQKEANTQKELNQAQQDNATVNTEAEVGQIQDLKGVVDSVSDAIDRKNDAFTEEGKIVAETVDSEIRKISDLIESLRNVLFILDDIKTKSEQSFVIPEFDESKLQTSFDAIYNKFLELRDKIGTMQIDIGVNGDNIKTAILEALYAKEITANYTKITDFNQLFTSEKEAQKASWERFLSGPPDPSFFPSLYDSTKPTGYINNFTGEVFDSLEKAMAEFEDFKGLYANKDTGFFGNTEEVLNDLIANMQSNSSNTPTTDFNDAAQVIIQAIETQGGKIVESIKLLIPKSTTENIDDSKLIDAFNALTDSINQFIENNRGYNASDYFDDVKQGLLTLPDNIINALKTLGLFNSAGDPNFFMPTSGGCNTGIAIQDEGEKGKKIVYHTTQTMMTGESSDVYDLMEKQNEAVKLGAQVPRIIAAYQDDNTDTVFQLQTKAEGQDFRSAGGSSGVFKATDEQIDRLLHTFEVLEKVGLYAEFGGSNALYDPENGFSVIDLAASSINGMWDEQNTAQDLLNSFLDHYVDRIPTPTAGDLTLRDDLRRRFEERAALPSSQRLVNADTIAAEQAQQQQMQGKSQETNNNVKLTPVMDEGAVAKVVQENVAQTPAEVKITPVEYRNANATDVSTAIMDYVDQFKNNPQVEFGKYIDATQANPILRQLADRAGLQDLGGVPVDYIFGNASADELEQYILEATEYIKQNPVQIPVTLYPSNNVKQEIQPVVDSAEKSAEATSSEAMAAEEAAKQFVDAAKAKKEFVEANKQVAESAEDSAEKVEKEADAAEEAKEKVDFNPSPAQQPDDWDKIEERKEDYDADPFAAVRRKTITNDAAFETVIEHLSAVRDEEGNLTGEMQLDTVTIINDYKKRADAIKKESEKIKVAQANVRNFLTQFDNKTMGEGSKLNGYQELLDLSNSDNFSIDDIEKSYAMMKNLDAEYNKVVQSIRKGSSSMNPFVNAINSMGKMEDVLYNIELEFKSLNHQPSELRERIIDLYRQFDNLSGETDIYKFADGFGNLKVSINAVTEAIRQTKKEQGLSNKATFLGLDIDAAKQGLGIMENKWRQQGLLTDEVRAKLQAMSEELSTITARDDFTVWTKKWRQFKQEVSNTKFEVESKLFNKGYAPTGVTFDAEQLQNTGKSLLELFNQINSQNFDGKGQFKSISKDMTELTFVVDNGKGAFETYAIAVDKATGATGMLQKSTKPAMTALQQIGQNLKKDFTGLAHSLIGGTGVYKFAQYVRQGIQSVRDLDTALTELKKVTDETEETYDKFLNTASQTAARIGSTMQDFTSSTADWARLGYSIADATKLAESTQILMNTSEFTDVSKATDSLISSIQAFDYTAEESMHVVDVLNEIGNNYAIKLMWLYIVIYIENLLKRRNSYIRQLTVVNLSI